MLVSDVCFLCKILNCEVPQAKPCDITGNELQKQNTEFALSSSEKSLDCLYRISMFVQDIYVCIGYLWLYRISMVV